MFQRVDCGLLPARHILNLVSRPVIWAAFFLAGYRITQVDDMGFRASLFLLPLLAGCASTGGAPELPYPAFVQSEDLATTFLATLPGVRATQFRSDMRSGSAGHRIDIPRDWTGSTGGAPGKALEVFVLAGEVRFSEFPLRAGGYAYVPPGSMGFRLESDNGAQILYFLDDVPESSVIRAPLILDSELLPWRELSPGHYVKALREDPGSGARTWLQRIDPGVSMPWQSSSVMREGYLVTGEYQHSECLDGRAETGVYEAGGYFRRPPGIIHAGPESRAIIDATWFLREPGASETNTAAWCGPSGNGGT